VVTTLRLKLLGFTTGEMVATTMERKNNVEKAKKYGFLLTLHYSLFLLNA
jgi:hypothetical protein